MNNPLNLPDNLLANMTMVCFSHLRWGFVYQRPQHLMTRFARTMRVVFVEEPITDSNTSSPYMDVRTCPKSGVEIATPRLPENLGSDIAKASLQVIIEDFLSDTPAKNRIFWFYTPMMLDLVPNAKAASIVYDCMDELSNFKGAPPEMRTSEQKLMKMANVVFTGGQALFEAKSREHSNAYPFPSGIEHEHFAKARTQLEDPKDQSHIPHPRLGFFGVIDERMDLVTLARLADERPEYSIVMIGPVVKISPEALPKASNIHYLGMKSYNELPQYLSGWDAALMNFAINDATKYISPTKTPEYLAGGKPVISTPVLDVVRNYGDLDAVFIAEQGDDFIEACDQALTMAGKGSDWMAASDERISTQSWDVIQSKMSSIIKATVQRSSPNTPAIRPSSRRKSLDVLIVGAGPAGCVMAQKLAETSNKRVLLIDKRPHIAGNTYDHLDAAGVMVHQYGPHIFHTNSADIFSYLSRFTAWRQYEHRVLADILGTLVPMPINRTTLNTLYNAGLETDEDAERFLASRAENVGEIKSSEDVVVSKIGRELYNTFFKHYSLKQWDIDPSNLDKSVTARVPTRTNLDDRYFTDQFQAMPLDGYTKMFERMTDHPNIKIETLVDYQDVRNNVDYDHTVFTGPVDEYFNYCYGKLPYRSLQFRHETLDQEWVQPVGTVNYPEPDVPYTRCTEYKHLTGQSHSKTSLTYEYGCADGDPYYPIPTAENHEIYKRYEALAREAKDVTFVGRLATYRYYNMDQVIGQALAAHRRLSQTFENVVERSVASVS